jgi:heme oxygenase (biliverdin-IX-beta and delta-forming)
LSANLLPVTSRPLREDILVRVKRKTQEQHRLLESILPIARADFSLADYLFVLEKFLGIYRTLEPRISNVRGLLASLQLERRKKAALLEQDLTDLGMDQETLNSLPQAPVVFLAGVPEALGAMYVLEGATLGGQFISRVVGQRFGLDQQKGCRFFLSYGGEVGRMWNSFGEIVRSSLSSVEEEDRFVATAIQTFSSFELWLRGKSNV